MGRGGAFQWCQHHGKTDAPVQATIFCGKQLENVSE